MTINDVGNVGIGLATLLTAPLTVYKDGGGNDNPGGGITLTRYKLSDSNFRGCSIWSVAYDNIDCMAFRSSSSDETYGGTAQMVLTKDGRLGIGTTSPIRKLDVRSGTTGSSTDWIAGTFGGTGGAGRVVMGNLLAKPVIGAHNSTLTLWETLYLNNPDNNVVVDTNGRLGIGTATPTTFFHTEWFSPGDSVWYEIWKHSFNSNWAFSMVQRHRPGVDASYGFRNRASNTDYEVMTFLSNKVGINNTNPGTALEVNGTISSPGFINITGSDPGDLIAKRYGSGDRYGIGQYGTGTTRVFTSNTYGESSIRFSKATDDVRSGSAGFTDLMTIKHNGFVGIGTTAPRNNLDVLSSQASMNIIGTTESDQVAMRLGTPHQPGEALKTAIIAEGITNWSRAKLHFCLNNDTNNSTAFNATVSHARMTITPNGNVGIGIVNPGSKLEVVGSIYASGNMTLSVFGSYLGGPRVEWTAPTLVNGWANYGAGFHDAAYRRDITGRVHLRGLIRSGSGVMFNIPFGLRPGATELFTVHTGGGHGRIDIQSNGNVVFVAGNNGYVQLSGLSYTAFNF
jgi:hypothetical protein